MKGRWAVVFAAAAVLLLGCSGRQGRIIPKSKMMDIYYDMFVADQWLSDHSRARRTADTTFFYEPIFRAHGYTFKDFDRSVSHYVADPERFAKMLEKVSDRLDKESKRLAEIKSAIDNFREIGGYEWKEFPSDTVAWPDSLVLWPLAFADTAGFDADTAAFPSDTTGFAADSVYVAADTTEIQRPDNDIL